MFRRLGQVLLVCALVVSIGAHWAALQSLAWVGMAVRFAQTDPLPEALSKTFDGQHPCSLCKVVAEGRQGEQKPSSLKVETRFDLMLFAEQIEVEAPPPFILFPRGPVSAEVRPEVPPLPPPRLA